MKRKKPTNTDPHHHKSKRQRSGAAPTPCAVPPWEAPEDKAATRAHGGERWWKQQEESIAETLGGRWSAMQKAGDTEYLAKINQHPRDTHITFRDKDHSYWYDDVQPFPRPSSTGFVHAPFEHFDADAIITKMMRPGSRKGWPREGYLQSNGQAMTRRQIKDMWACNGAVASAVGTAIHQMVEWACNAEASGRRMKLAKTRDGKYTPEAQMFLEWNAARKAAKEGGDTKDDPYMEHYRTEWSVYLDDAQLAGQIDWVGIDRWGRLHIRDWKTCKELVGQHIKGAERWARYGQEPCNKLVDCKHVHYELQQNVYKLMLEKQYGFQVASMGIVVFNRRNPDCKARDGSWTFGSLPVRDLQTVAAQMVMAREARMASLPPLGYRSSSPTTIPGSESGVVRDESKTSQAASGDAVAEAPKAVTLRHRSGRVLAIMRRLAMSRFGKASVAIRDGKEEESKVSVTVSVVCTEPVTPSAIRSAADSHPALAALRATVPTLASALKRAADVLETGRGGTVATPVGMDMLLRPFAVLSSTPVRAVVITDAPWSTEDGGCPQGAGVPLADLPQWAPKLPPSSPDESTPWYRRVEKWAAQGVLLLFQCWTLPNGGRKGKGMDGHRAAWQGVWQEIVRALPPSVPVLHWCHEPGESTVCQMLKKEGSSRSAVRVDADSFFAQGRTVMPGIDDVVW